MKIINNLHDVENISKNIKNKDNEKCQKCIKKQENIIKDNKTNEKYIQSQNKEEFNNLNYDNTGISTFNIEKLKKQDEAKTRIMKFITYKKRTEQEIRNKFKNEIQEEILEEVIEYKNQTVKLVKLTSDNVSKVEAMISTDSDYKKTEIGEDGIVYKQDGTIKYIGSSKYWILQLKEIIDNNILDLATSVC